MPDITTHSDGYALKLDNDRGVIVEVKDRLRPSADWRLGAGVWVVGDSLAETEELIELAKKHGWDWDPAAWAKASSIVEAGHERLTQAAELDEGLLGKIGRGGLQLRSYQAAAVPKLVEWKRAILNDPPGLGKTMVSTAAMDVANAYPALVVSPSNLLYTWQDAIADWATLNDPTSQVVSSGNEGLEDVDVHITTWDLVPTMLDDLRRVGYTCIIFDELHRVRNYRTDRAQAAYKVSRGVPYRWGLTGTLFVNGLKDGIHPLKVIDRLEDVGGFDYVSKRYCNKQKIRVGWDPEKMEPIYRTDLSGFDDAEKARQRRDEFMDKLLKTCVIRREKDQVVHDLPPKTKSVVRVDISNRAEYEREAQRLAEKGDRGNGTAALERINVLGHITALGKVKAVSERIDDVLGQGEKVVVFTYHRDVIDQFIEMYPDAEAIQGSTSATQREAIVRRFQHEEEPRVLLANFKAAGEALTLTRASKALFCEVWWNPATHEQALDRLHRIGQDEPVFGEFFLGRDTVDEYKWQVVEEKRDSTEIDTSEMAAQIVRRLDSS